MGRKDEEEQSRNSPLPLHPPSVLERSQTNAAPLCYSPELLQMRILEMIRDPQEANRKNAEHATRMGIDPEAVMKRWGLKGMGVVLKTPPQTQDRVPVTSHENDVQMDELTSPSELDNASPSREEVQMKNTFSLAEHDVSTLGNDPWMDCTMSPVDPKRPDMQHNAMKPRKQNSGTQRARTKSQKTPRRASKVEGSKDRKVKEEMFKTALAKIPTDASPKTEDIRKVVAVSPETMDHTPSLFVGQIDKYPVLNLPKWYTDISTSNFKMKEIAKKRPLSHTSLESLKNCVGRCEVYSHLAKPAERRALKGYFNELRDHIHKAEFLLDINMYLVKSVRILTVENGLPRIFGDNACFPWDLKADAYQLYARWIRGEFQQDVLRGVVTVKGPNRGSDRLDPAYKAKYPTSAKRYGDDGLVLGQCWPSQLCTVRDGAHGSSQGGIFGDREKGAYSIVLSGGGGYHDKDDGDIIVYSGTEGKNFVPTEATQQMIISSGLGNEIRVLRSHQLPSKNKYRPEVGLRYDGLYKIKTYELVDKERQTHLFTLERCFGQEKIRYGDDAASRPTRFEIAEYKKLKERI